MTQSLDRIISNCFKRAGNRCEMEKRVGLWDRERCPEVHLQPAKTFKGRVVLRPFYVVKSKITEDRIIMLCSKCHNEVMEKARKNFKLRKKKVGKEQTNMFGGV